jgi:hypothetical protein
MSFSRPVHTTAQHAFAPAIKPTVISGSNRIAFLEDVTEIDCFQSFEDPLTSPSTPRRKMSLQDESLDPPRSFSDSTGLRPILLNRQGTSYTGPFNSRSRQSSVAGRYATTGSGGMKPPPRLPFSYMPAQQTAHPQPTRAAELDSQAAMKGLPRNSISIPLVISQRRGYKWPRPDQVDVAKANGLKSSSAPTTTPSGFVVDSQGSNTRPRKSDPATLDDTYAAKGYGWARPKPLRLSGSSSVHLPGIGPSMPSSPSETQFGTASSVSSGFSQAQAAHHTAMMTAGLDAIHSRISALDRRSDKLCSVMEKLTLALEGLTDRLNSGSRLEKAADSYGEQGQLTAAPLRKYSYSKQQYGVESNPNVVTYNFTNSNSNDSPRISEATLHGYATPKTNMFGEGINPFESRSRKQSRVSVISGGNTAPEEDAAEVKELLKKRLSRGRQQSFWEPETEDEEGESEEASESHNDGDDEGSFKSGTGDGPSSDVEQPTASMVDMGTRHENRTIGSWTSEASPRTRNPRDVPILQIPNFAIVPQTAVIQTSPGSEQNTSQSPADLQIQDTNLSGETAMSPTIPDIFKDSTLDFGSDCESCSSTYSIPTSPSSPILSHMPSLSMLPALPPSSVATPTLTPANSHLQLVMKPSSSPLPIQKSPLELASGSPMSNSTHSSTPTIDGYKAENSVSPPSNLSPPLPQQWLARSASNGYIPHDDQASPPGTAVTTEEATIVSHNLRNGNPSLIGMAMTLSIRNPGSPSRVETVQKQSPPPSSAGDQSHQTPATAPTTLLHNHNSSSSFSIRSYSPTELSYRLPEPRISPRPSWYFFYGTLLDPSLLIELLGLKAAPMMMRARVRSHALKYYGVQPAAIPLTAQPDKFVDGAAWYVPDKVMAAWLRSHEEEDGRMVEQGVEIEFADEMPIGSGTVNQMDVNNTKGRKVMGRMFMWKGEEEGLMNHPII